ncbi:PREDICTED: pentatricopeptide repeat-containing protein At5g42450, mitochondrial-like [Camelina sativa]|uniref:Pentatricopeptide repeat-containing protein At5g42450, mitochondrial-like n=1 Tax=Camelina sativa TaxID=90675 RepID=A0ABM1QLE5_CAMSA|nr:PREDICTED: pentatricopeptide repeat-containing protein At5g42450, mitochondrial-like [Camelina sativa]
MVLSQRLFLSRKSHSFASAHVTKSHNSIPNPVKHLESDLVCNAHHAFDEIPDLNVISATAVIGRFVKQNRHVEASHAFKRLLCLGIRPNEFTFGTVIGSSSSLRDIKWGKQLHCYALKVGLSSNVFVGSAVLNCYVKLSTLVDARKSFDDTRDPNVVSITNLISGYLKKHEFEEALLLFRTMPEKSVVTWNAVIGGFSQTGQNEEAVNTFVDMLREGVVMPNESTFPCAITAVSNIASQGAGKSIHACVIKFLGQQFSNVYIGNSLISFYSKCGNMEDSLLAFNKLREEERNIVSWNSIIWGYAHNGRGEEAIAMFEKMVSDTNLKPNNVTLLGLLFACNHSGLIQEGYMYFNKAVNGYDDPNLLQPEHYACMVDMLSRSGHFKEAEELIKNSLLAFNKLREEERNIVSWNSIIWGYAHNGRGEEAIAMFEKMIHSNKRLAKLVASKILEMDPRDVSSYVMLSNAYSAAGKWQNVSEIRRKMKEMGLKRVTGCSWIEVRDQGRVFVNADKKNELKGEVYRMLTLITQHLRGR